MNNFSKTQQSILIIFTSAAITLLAVLILVFTNMDFFYPIPTLPTPAPTLAVLAATTQPPIPIFTAVMPATWTPQPSPINGFTREPSSTMVASPTNAVITLRAMLTRSARQSNPSQPYLALTFSDEYSEYQGFTWLHMTAKVHNTGTLAVYLLQIRVTILDKHGQQINNRSFFIDSEWLYPGTSSTFSADINDPDHATKSIHTDYASFFYKDANGNMVSYP